MVFTIYRYECALIQNQLHQVPVFPIFLAEITGKDASTGELTFEKFTAAKIDFPDVPHHRNDSTEILIDNMR